MRVHRFVTNDFSVRIAAVDATSVVGEMQAISNSYPLATLGVGRAMVGALLMASHLKNGQEIGVLFRGSGPLASVYAQASFEGHVRGYCPVPYYLPPQPEDAMNLGKALGLGQLTVSRQQPFQRSPHYGTVEMVSGEIGDDIAHYLHQSHQIRSIVSLGVYLDSYGKVKAAGGVLIEVMPGVEEALVQKIQENVNAHKEGVSQSLLNGRNPQELVEPYLKGLAFTEIPHDYSIVYSCPCSTDRVSRALGTLGLEDLNDMIEKQEKAEITCQMCGRHYTISIEDLTEIKNELYRNSLN